MAALPNLARLGRIEGRARGGQTPLSRWPMAGNYWGKGGNCGLAMEEQMDPKLWCVLLALTCAAMPFVGIWLGP